MLIGIIVNIAERITDLRKDDEDCDDDSEWDY